MNFDQSDTQSPATEPSTNSSQSPVSTNAGVMQLTVNGQPQSVPVGSTITEVLASFGVRTELVAVEVNLEIIPKPQHSQTVLNDGDQVEVVTLVGGG